MRLVEKYRPRSLDEVIGQEHVKRAIRNIIQKGPNKAPHMLFSGYPGTGKTTIARIIALSWFGSASPPHYFEFNASDERGISVVRDRIKKLAFSRNPKIIFLDEADNMTGDAQEALRRVMELSVNTVFILCCNYENKIIDPIRSRCLILRFHKLSPRDIAKRLIFVMRQEGIQAPRDLTIKVLRRILELSDGDMRRALNLLESAITADKGLDYDALESRVVEVDFLQQAFDMCLRGDLKGAKIALENVLAGGRYVDGMDIVDRLYRIIADSGLEDAVKARLFYKLAELERGLKMGTLSLLVQLMGFFAYVWISQYLPSKCPLLSGE